MYLFNKINFFIIKSEVDNAESYLKDLKEFITLNLCHASSFNQRSSEDVRTTINKILQILFFEKNDFPYIIGPLKALWAGVLTEEEVWEISILMPLFHSFQSSKAKLIKKVIEFSLNPTQIEILNENLNPLIKEAFQTKDLEQLSLMADFTNDLEVVLSINRKERKAFLNNRASKNTYSLSPATSDLLKKIEFSLLQFRSFCKISQIDLILFTTNSKKQLSNLSNNNPGKLTLEKIKNSEKSFLKNIQSVFSELIPIDEAEEKQEKVKADMKDQIIKLISLQLYFYQPLNKLLFDTIKQFTKISIEPTSDGVSKFHIFSKNFYLKKSPAYSYQDFEGNSKFLNLLKYSQQYDLKLDILIDKTKLQELKANLFIALTFKSSNSEWNIVREQVVENLLILFTETELESFTKQLFTDLKEKAEENEIKKQTKKLHALLNSNCRLNLQNATSKNLQNEYPLSEEISPKIMSVVFDDIKNDLHIVVLNCFGVSQQIISISNFFLYYNSDTYNFSNQINEPSTLISQQMMQKLLLDLSVHNPEIIAIGYDSTSAIYLKRIFTQLAIELKSKGNKYFSYYIYM